MRAALVCVGCFDGSLHGWAGDPSAGEFELLFAFAAHDACIKGLAVSRDGRLAATGSQDETVQVFDLARRRSIAHCLGVHTDPVTHVAFAGELVLSGDASGKIFMFKNGKAIHELRGHKADSQVTSIAVHPTERVALTTAMDNSLRLWDLVNAKAAPRTRLNDFKSLSCACWAPDGERYGVVGDDKVVVVMNADAVDDRPLCTVPHPRRVNALQFCEDVVLISACDDGVLRVIGADGSLVRSFACPQNSERPVRIRDVGFIKVPIEGESAHEEEEEEEEEEDLETFLFGACSDGVVRVWNLDNDKTDEAVAQLPIGTSAHVVCMTVSKAPPMAGVEAKDVNEASESEGARKKKKKKA